MRFLQMKWIVPVLLIAVIYVADQIRIGRPDHKYRLTVAVETLREEPPRLAAVD